MTWLATFFLIPTVEEAFASALEKPMKSSWLVFM
jgi:hypothetical protein